MRLDNKIAIIVGAGQTPGETIGNGRATAILFAREGATLLLVDRDLVCANETAKMILAEGGQCSTFQADASIEADCEALIKACIERYGRIDILNNVVGIGAGDRSITSITEDAWDMMMNVNMKSVLFTVKYALPHMREREQGSIVNISSVAAIASVGYVGYKVSKAGVNALTQSIATSNAKYGIRANVVMPGLLDTPMAIEGNHLITGTDREKLRAERHRKVPLRHKMGTAWDTAYAALFLASDESQFITGSCFRSMVVQQHVSVNQHPSLVLLARCRFVVKVATAIVVNDCMPANQRH
ncbi:MAG: NAD(P)-dependent dehydrogenase (short-subunit alcohol dehydrogenase family) [Candidatus Azotimanducaceae bacterium]|jgi:NAD(P)-dependent dehydrogenase (short-subunit alcohol dehydrogenase family)